MFSGTYMANNGYTQEKAEQALQADTCDLIAFGVPFIANPDLVLRFQNHAELNTADQSTFYGGDAQGYTDYPYLSA
jgi:N-ethylmaleimide reductase